jgi:arabinoxylan arabinofuranohydrolase
MNNLKSITVLFLLTIIMGFSQNPIVPPGMYIADPEAHVWEDGKLYIYGSRDESENYWCSYTHHVLSTSNLQDWNITENAFASKGAFDQVAYHDKLLFAPDCAYKDGTYYLYYCSPGKKLTEGVATSSNPNGPFINGKQIKGAYQIDPAVLIDSDGEGYYYWGQGKPKVAKLYPNLIEIDSTTITEPLDVEGNKAFHEGSSIRKIGDLYYLVFADDSRRDRPTCLGYAIGKSPMGPFEYQGIIIDNFGCDPASWNNHGSIEKFKNQWYVFYHRSTNNSRKFRKTCIEPIFINKDGTIDEVEMTSQGASSPLLASNLIQAEWACQLTGNVRVGSLSSLDLAIEGLTEIKKDDTAAFKFLSFEEGFSNIEIKTSALSLGTIEIRLDGVEGQLIGTFNINPRSKNSPYQISKFPVSEIKKGKHAIYLIFKTDSGCELTLDWFRFL